MAEFNIDKLNIQITANATKASSSLDKLNSKVSKLQKTLAKSSTSSTKFTKSMTALRKTTKAIDVKPLTSLSSSLKTITSQESAINRVTASLSKLSASTKKISTLGTSTTTGSKSSGGATGLLGIFGKLGSLALVYYGLKRVGQGLAYTTQIAVDATEQLNLFNVSLGQNAVEVGEWVNAYADATGFDPFFIGENVANFYRIADAMGLATDKAKILATNFAALGFDLSSLVNLQTEDAFVKLGAGLVGETEPLRRVGVILTENNLAETASRLGIEKSIRTMTESEKIQLRYLALLEQTTVTQGDLARTIEQPANQLKILKDQFIQLGRAIGVLLINFIGPALPYFIALTHVITDLVKGLGALLGIDSLEFEGTNTDNNGGGITDGLYDIEEAADAASAALKGVLAPFDELNVLTAQTSSSDFGGLSDTSGLIDVPLPEYGNLIESLDLKWKGLTKTIEASLAKFKEFFSGVNTTALSESLDLLGVALEPFLTGFGNGFDYFLQDIVKPLMEWTINEALPTIIEAIAIALIHLNNAIVEIKKEGLITWLKGKFDELDIGSTETWKGLLKFGKQIKYIYSTFIKPYLISWGEDFSDLYTDDLKPFLDDVKELTEDLFKLFEHLGIDMGTIFAVLGIATAIGLDIFKTSFITGIRFFTQELDAAVLQADGLVKILQGIATVDIVLVVEGLATYLEGFVNMFASALNFIFNTFIDTYNDFAKIINPALWLMGGSTLPILDPIDVRVDYTSAFDQTPVTNSSFIEADRASTATTGGGSGTISSGNGVYDSFVKETMADMIEILAKAIDDNLNTGDVILQVDGTVLGKAALDAQNATDRQSGGATTTRPIKALIQ